jgi:NADPH:quinone reductase-like Zn-dependent oxidoreductase
MCIRKDKRMKAVVYQRYGSPDVLKLQEIDKPTVMGDEVLIRVHAAALTPFEWHFLTGEPFVVRLMAGLLRPRHQVLGHDVAGRVEAVGANARQFRPGDEVFGRSADGGGFAEYVCVPEAAMMPKPAGLLFEEAAAVQLSAVTALIGLLHLGQNQSGQKVLINGASGGVGTLAVQIAKLFGAEVTGVCSTRHLDLVRSLGADHVIDYTQEDFPEKEGHYDLIFDVVAKRSFSDCRRALGPKGIYVTTEWTPALTIRGWWVATTGSQRMISMLPDPRGPARDVLDLYERLVGEGTLTTVIDSRYPLREVPDAFRHYEKGHTQGRIVITV